jgi:ABC-type Fe3+/spermidine/putrescine transport system ATPase subunit
VSSNTNGRVTLDVPSLGPVVVATSSAVVAGAQGSIALRPEKIVLDEHAREVAADNHFRGTVSDFLYHGDVTVYMITTAGGARIEALSANSAVGRTKFFEVGDAVDLSWPAAAGHFIAG